MVHDVGGDYKIMQSISCVHDIQVCSKAFYTYLTSQDAVELDKTFHMNNSELKVTKMV